jgi:hypothetical protein
MAASFVVVIHGIDSRIIRRVIVASTDAEASRAAVLRDGEARIDLPMKNYGAIADGNLHAAVAAIIGEPAHHGRVVEVDPSGAVVAAYMADPLLDAPTIDASHTLELHATAAVGDVRVVDAVDVLASRIDDARAESIFMNPDDAEIAKAAILDGALAIVDGSLVATDSQASLSDVLGRVETVKPIDILRRHD